MIAFHGSEEVKAKYVARVEAHRSADEIIQRQGWDNGKGCAVGCTLDGYSHSRYPIELGIPIDLARLEDQIHEGLPFPDFKDWPLQFLTAPKVGADLSQVWPQFAIWLLVNSDHGVIRFVKTDEQRSAISEVADLYRDKVPREDKRWEAARLRAAYAASASAYTASAAAFAAAAFAAATPITPITSITSTAAYAYAADYDDADADRENYWKLCAKKLIELLKAA